MHRPSSRSSRPLLGLVFVFFGLAIIAPPAGAGGKKKPAFDPAIPSYVNIQQLLSEYRKTPAWGKYQARLRDRAKTYGLEMQALASVRFGTEEERKEALAIRAKDKLTDEETARMAELKKKTEAVANERAALAQKAKPSDEDAKRLQELAKLDTEAVRMLSKEDGDRREGVRRMEVELMSEVETELLKMVEKLAKDKKIDFIYERKALLFGGQDLTEEAVRRLPK